MANTLAYYDTATITAVKSFVVQAPGVRTGLVDIVIVTSINVGQVKLKLSVEIESRVRIHNTLFSS